MKVFGHRRSHDVDKGKGGNAQKKTAPKTRVCKKSG